MEDLAEIQKVSESRLALKRPSRRALGSASVKIVLGLLSILPISLILLLAPPRYMAVGWLWVACASLMAICGLFFVITGILAFSRRQLIALNGKEGAIVVTLQSLIRRRVECIGFGDCRYIALWSWKLEEEPEVSDLWNVSVRLNSGKYIEAGCSSDHREALGLADLIKRISGLSIESKKMVGKWVPP